MQLRFIGFVIAFLLYVPTVFSQETKTCSIYDSVPPLFVVELDSMWIPGIDKPKTMKQTQSSGLVAGASFTEPCPRFALMFFRLSRRYNVGPFVVARRPDNEQH